MSKREGPNVRIDASCLDCRYEHSESYAVQGDSGHDVSCAHPDAPGNRRIDPLAPHRRSASERGGAVTTYRDIGAAHWLVSGSGKYDPIGVELVRGHYSRRKPNSPQFMPPGETFVLITRDRLSVWGWWRPHPRSGIKAMNGLDGWTCSVFARHGGPVASQLVLDAERALSILDASGDTAAPCGPDGMLTYVDPRRIKSRNPGYCFKCAGWRPRGTCAKKRKPLLWKPWSEAGRLEAAA